MKSQRPSSLKFKSSLSIMNFKLTSFQLPSLRRVSFSVPSRPRILVQKFRKSKRVQALNARLKETYHYRRLSVESPGKVPRRSLESVTTQQTTLNQAPLVRVPTIATVILTKWRPQFLTSQLTLAQR